MRKKVLKTKICFGRASSQLECYVIFAVHSPPLQFHGLRSACVLQKSVLKFKAAKLTE